MSNNTNESDDAYARRIAAGKLLTEAPKGARFEYNRYPDDHNSELYDPCSADEVFALFAGGGIVRIAPTPKKVLRPAWEILREATSNGLVRTYAGETLIYKNAGFQITLADIFTHEGMPQDELNAEWPDWFFTTEEAKR